MKPFKLILKPRKGRVIATSSRRSVADDERGFALPAVLMLLVLLATLGVATILYTRLDFKSTQHFATGNQAFAAAEAGLLDVVNNIQTRNVVNFANDVVAATPAVVSATPVPIVGYSNFTYTTTIVSGPTPASQGILTATGLSPSSAERVIKLGLQRGPLRGGPGALHLSNDSALGTFSGNSMTIDGNNWNVTDITTNPPVAALDPSVAVRPAISTRNDTVTTQVVTALAGQGTITGLGTAPSVYTTASASTADLQRFVTDILAANGAPGGCNRTGGGTEYWLPGPCGSGPPGAQCGVHCIRQTNGNASNGADFWGSMTVPNVTYVGDTSAKIAGGSYGAGILIFSGDANMNGSFSFCGWVLFLNPSANGITIQGNPTIYGEVLSPLAAFTGGGSITIKYSQNCLIKADGAGINPNGNLPHPVVITSWTES